MTPPGFQFTIGRLMGWVSAVAVALAFWPTPIGPLALLFLALGGVVKLLAKAPGMTRVRAVAWVFSAYPLLLIGGGMVCMVAPQLDYVRPGQAAVIGLLPAFLLSVGGVLAEADRAARDPKGRIHKVAGLALFALLSWAGLSVLVSSLTPFRTC